MAETDWAAWSREAKRLMQERNEAWQREWELPTGAAFRWTLDPPELVFRRVAGLLVADITVVGTCSQHEGTFLWAWANETMPEVALRGLDRVRAFGEEHDLGMLVDPEWAAGHADALEALVIAGRLLDAEGVFSDNTRDVTVYFTLRGFRPRSSD